MEQLNFPAYPFRVREEAGRHFVYDVARRKYVRLTPEEWVRQHVVAFLVRERGYPQALIAVEQAFTYQAMARRADVIAFDRKGAPLLMAECKAPDVVVGQEAFDQVVRYNRVIGARYLFVTNGRTHLCCHAAADAAGYRFLDDVPSFEEALSA